MWSPFHGAQAHNASALRKRSQRGTEEARGATAFQYHDGSATIFFLVSDAVVSTGGDTVRHVG